MRKLQRFRVAATAAGCLLAAAGGAQAAGGKHAAGGKAHAAGGKTRPVAIRFALTVDGKEVGCGAPLANLGSGRLAGKLKEARLYLYGFELVDAKGARTPVSLAQNDWQYADVALLDFKDARGGNAPCTEANPAKNTTVAGTVPRGRYVGLRFSVGAPVESIVDGEPVSINHSNVETAPPPLDIAGMAWNWQAGRRFVTIEVVPPTFVIKADGSKSRSWMVHLGSTGCKGNPATGEIVSCAHENRFSVALDRFDPKTQRVELDLAKLLDGSDITADKGGAVGCMAALDDPECPAVFRRLGLNLGDSAPGAGDAGKQTTPGVSPIFSAGPAAPAKVAGGKR